MKRATLSFAPPAAVGRMSSTGFSGRHDDCPQAWWAPPTASKASSAAHGTIRGLPHGLIIASASLDECRAVPPGPVLPAARLRPEVRQCTHALHELRELHLAQP